METTFPLLFAAVVGFGHAFEADHLVAVSSLVTKQRSLGTAVKDGIYWGLGHSSTILLVGLVMIVG
ncbi:MAG: urease accessory protein, partial [Bacteroidota bacterium]